MLPKKRWSKNTLIFLLIQTCTFLSMSGQQENDPISIHSFNEKYLEHLVKIKIDEVRTQHGLKPLYNDSILFVAAKFHAGYLFEKGELSHTEPENKKMETPQKRAEAFGAVNYLVGENVIFTLVNIPMRNKKNKTYINRTYLETANDMVTSWVNSPGHYKNIITADYNATGLAVWKDPKTGRIYGVQKFAKILFKYSFEESKTFFDYSQFVPIKPIHSFDGISNKSHPGKHAYKLKGIKDSAKCKRCFAADTLFRFGMTRIKYKGDNIYLESDDLNPIFDLLKKRKDGFAAEIVNYTPFDCGNPEYYTIPSRRNKQCLFNGKLLKPIYRKKALRGFKGGGGKRKTIAKKLKEGKLKNKYLLKLGKIPKNQSDYFEVNLVMIQKKRVCKVMHFSSVCGDTLERFYELPFYHDTLSNVSEIQSDYRNFEFSVPFQKNKVDFKLSDVKPIMDSVMSENFIADTIQIKAFSSVEGSTEINKQLQEKRAQNLATAICSNQKRKVVRVITAEENWNLFNEQIAKNKELEVYKTKNKTEIKKELEDTLKQKKYEKYLQPQRFAKVRVHAREPISDKNIASYLSTKIRRIDRDISSCIQKRKTDSLVVLLDSITFMMEVAYNKIKQNVLPVSFFDKFDINEGKEYNNYNETRLKYKLQLLGLQENDKAWVKDIYTELVTLYNSEARNFFINYNMLNLIQRYGKDLDIKIDDAQKNNYVSELKTYAETDEEKILAEKIGLNFWFEIARVPITELPETRQEPCLQALLGIHNYFSFKELSMDDRNKLGEFYLYHSMVNWVVDLLEPEFIQRKNNPEGLKTLAKTLYQNYEETQDEAYYEFLKQVYDIIGKENWCPMFVGPCNISFQAFDYEAFRNYYCERCSDYLNYAKGGDKDSRQKNK